MFSPPEAGGLTEALPEPPGSSSLLVALSILQLSHLLQLNQHYVEFLVAQEGGREKSPPGLSVLSSSSTEELFSARAQTAD